MLGKVGVDDRQRQRVKRQIPGRVPGVLPLVGHRDDVLVQHVVPLRVPHVAITVMQRVGAMLVEPVVPVEEEELLAPEHACQGLTHHVGGVCAHRWRRDRRVEVVGFTNPRGENVVERLPEGPLLLRRGAREPHANHFGLAGADGDRVVCGDLRTLPGGVHRTLAAVDHAVVDAVLDVRAFVVLPRKEPHVVRFVLGEEQRHVALARQDELTEQGVLCRRRAHAFRRLRLTEVGLGGGAVGFGNPGRPVVAEPQRRQEMQVRRVRSAVDGRDAHEDVFGSTLGVFHEDIEIAVVLEDAGVEELVLHLIAGPPAVGLHQVGVGKRSVRVPVQKFHVRVRRGAIDVEVVLLDVLAVVPLAVGQAEEPLLEDRILPVPQGQREAEALLVVRDAGQAVFAPAIGA